MPFKSEKQRRYLFSQKPDVARKFAPHGKFTGEESAWRGWDSGGSSTVQGNVSVAAEGGAEAAWEKEPGAHTESERELGRESVPPPEQLDAKIGGPRGIRVGVQGSLAGFNRELRARMKQTPGGRGDGSDMQPSLAGLQTEDKAPTDTDAIGNKAPFTNEQFLAAMRYERDSGSGESDKAVVRRVKEHLDERSNYYEELEAMVHPDHANLVGKMKHVVSFDKLNRLVTPDETVTYNHHPAAHAVVDDIWRDDLKLLNGAVLRVPRKLSTMGVAGLESTIHPERPLHCGNCSAYAGGEALSGKCGCIQKLGGKPGELALVHYFNTCGLHRHKEAGAVVAPQLGALDSSRPMVKAEGGPFLGPKGGMWKDAKHTIAYKRSDHIDAKRAESAAHERNRPKEKRTLMQRVTGRRGFVEGFKASAHKERSADIQSDIKHHARKLARYGDSQLHVNHKDPKKRLHHTEAMQIGAYRSLSKAEGGGWETGPRGGIRKRSGKSWVYMTEHHPEHAQTKHELAGGEGGTPKEAPEGDMFDQLMARGFKSDQEMGGHLVSVSADDLVKRGTNIITEIRKRDPQLAIEMAGHLGGMARSKGGGRGRGGDTDPAVIANAKGFLRAFNQAAAPASILGPEFGGLLAPGKAGTEEPEVKKGWAGQIAPIGGSSPREETPSLPDFQEIYYQPKDSEHKLREAEHEAVRRRASSERNTAVYGFHGAVGDNLSLEPVLRYEGDPNQMKDSVMGPMLTAREPVAVAPEVTDRLKAGATAYGDDGSLPGKTDHGRAPRTPDRRDDSSVPDVNGRPTPTDEGLDVSAEDDEDDDEEDDDDSPRRGARGRVDRTRRG